MCKTWLLFRPTTQNPEECFQGRRARARGNDLTIKFYVAGKAVDPTSVGVRGLGFGVPVTNLPTLKYECCVPIADALGAIERPFAALMQESKEELQEGILEPEYAWLVTEWRGGDVWEEFRANESFVVKVMFEFLALELATETAHARGIVPRYVVNTVDSVRRDSGSIVFGGEVYIHTSR